MKMDSAPQEVTVTNSHYRFTKHARDRMSQRRVDKHEIFETLRNGEQELSRSWDTIHFILDRQNQEEVSPPATIVVVDPWTATIITVYRKPFIS